MKTIDGQKIEIKFSPYHGGWNWLVTAVAGGCVLTSCAATDKASGRREIKAILKDIGVV